MIKTQIFKDQYVELSLVNGIVHLRHLQKNHLTLDLAMKIVDERLKATNETTYPMCIDVRNIAKVDEDAMCFLSKGDSIKYISAGAFITGCQLSRFLATTFIRIKRPPIIAKFFTNESTALKWLEFYKYQNLN